MHGATHSTSFMDRRPRRRLGPAGVMTEIPIKSTPSGLTKAAVAVRARRPRAAPPVSDIAMADGVVLFLELSTAAGQEREVMHSFCAILVRQLGAEAPRQVFFQKVHRESVNFSGTFRFAQRNSDALPRSGRRAAEYRGFDGSRQSGFAPVTGVCRRGSRTCWHESCQSAGAGGTPSTTREAFVRHRRTHVFVATECRFRRRGGVGTA